MNSAGKSKNFFNKSKETLTDILNKPITYTSKALAGALIVASTSCGLYSSNGNNLIKNDVNKPELHQPSGVNDDYDHHIPPYDYGAETAVVEPDTVVEPIIREPVVADKPVVQNSVAQRRAPVDVVSSMPAKAESQTLENIKRAQEQFKTLTPLEQLIKANDWLINKQTDSLEMVFLGNNELYHSSGATIMPSTVSGIGSTVDINDELYTLVRMVGSIGADGEIYDVFPNEDRLGRALTTTPGSVFNAFSVKDDPIKTSFNYQRNWHPDSILIYRTLDENKVKRIDYLGTVNTDNITLRLMPDGTLENHARFTVDARTELPEVPDNVLPIPTRNIVEKNYSPELLNQLKDIMRDHELKIAGLKSDIDDYALKIEEVEDLADRYKKESDSVRVEKSALGELLSKWNIGVLGGVSYDLNNGIIGGEIGGFAGFGRLNFGVLYSPSLNEVQTGTDFFETRVEAPPGRNSSLIALIRNTNTEERLASHSFEAVLFYQISDRVSLMGTGGIRNNIETTKTTEEAFMEHRGPDDTVYQIALEKKHPHVETNNYNVPIVGAGINVGITNRIGVYVGANAPISGDFNPKDIRLRGGLKFSLRPNQVRYNNYINQNR